MAEKCPITNHDDLVNEQAMMIEGALNSTSR